jgi:uncharacterized protein YigA (DUF484 family)
MSQDLQASQVINYLQKHPDFFYQAPELLETLMIPHPTSGKEISLLERQVFQLRQKNMQIQANMETYMDNARANIEIAQKVQAFAIRLMEAKDVTQAVNIILEEMQNRFNVEQCLLHSFGLPDVNVCGISQLGVSRKWSEAMRNVLQPMKPHCGLLENEWRKGIFAKTDQIQSICLLPLGSDQVWGMLALGSNDQRFEPNDTYFLKFFCQMITAKLDSLFE